MRILLLTTMLILAACGWRQPAQPPKSAAEIQQLIRIGDEAIDVALKVYSGAPASETEEATREMITALDAAKKQTDEILGQVTQTNHLEGRKDPMGVSGCIRANRMEVGDIENMSPTTKMTWSMKVGGCASSANIYFHTAPASDNSAPALALNIIDPIMLVAGTRSGLKRGAVMGYLDSNKSIIAKLAPACEKTGKASATGEVSYRCAAYEVAIAVQPKLQQLAGASKDAATPAVPPVQ